MHLRGYNTKQICPVCGFNILLLHALLPDKTKNGGLTSCLDPIPFNTPNLKMTPRLRVHPHNENPGYKDALGKI